MYDSIESLPIVRFHKYQKLLLIDSGVGADIDSLDQRLEKARRFLMAGKNEQAEKELENLRQCVHLVQTGLSPKHMAFAALVTKVDGKEYDGSDEALQSVTDLLSDVTEGELTAQIEAVKKKIDTEISLYFPRLFDDSEVKEYYDLLRKRTLKVLEGISNGERGTSKEVDELTTKLMTFTNPKTYNGSDGMEVQYDREFENVCLAMSEQLHTEPKKQTVMEYYNAFDYMRERQRAAERQKRG